MFNINVSFFLSYCFWVKMFLKMEAARENNNTQGDEGGEDQEDTDQEDAQAYIPGASLLAKLNTRDLRRLDNDAEFDTRLGSLHKSKHYEFTVFSLQVFC